MPVDNSYKRGSEWKKWDLQLQTILDDDYVSIENYWNELKEEFPKKCNLLIKKIGSEDNIKKYDSRDYFFTDSTDDEKTKSKNYSKLFLNFIDIFNEEIGAICITDHNYDHNILLDTLVKEAEKFNMKVIPGVEINIQGVHVLVLWGETFYKKSTFSESIKHFLSKIDINNKKDSGILTVCSKSYIDVIPEINKTKGILIYPHCNSDNGLFQERGKTDRTHLANWFNYQRFNILQAKNKKSADVTSQYIKRKIQDLKSGFVFTIGVDSRSLRNVLQPDEDGNYCWIKSDPTFEGLKQIIYEPHERAKIQKNNPDFEYDKPYFDNIKTVEEINIFENIQDNSQQVYFEKTSIPLNKNLVAIIGGRGEGKSLLVNYLANLFNKFDNESDDKFSKNVNFKVVYSKNNAQLPDTEVFIGDLENELDFLFIPQNKLKDLSEKKRVGKEIKKLLNLEDLQFDIELSNKTKDLLRDIRAIKEWFQEKDEDGDSYHNEVFIEKFKSKYEKLLKNITTKENKEKLEQYTTNIKQIKSIENLISRLNALKNQLIKTKSGLNNEISELNKILKKDNQIKDVSFPGQIDQINKNIAQYIAEKTSKEDENKKIKNDFEKSGFSGDLSSLLSNAKDYQGNVGWAEEKLKQISKNNIKLDLCLEKRSQLGKSIKKEYERQAKIITNAWKKIIDNIEDEEHKKLMKDILSDRDISISGEIVFDKDIFYRKLQDYIDMRLSSDIKEDLNLKDVTDFSEFVKSRLPSYVEGEKHEKTKVSLGKLLFDLQERKEYLYTQPKVTYKGKPLHRLSVGQRGTVYLCLKLATGAFSKPIIFDQPEDDLDNEFIMNELIGIFKKLKKYRQTIILTHNANLVVNADAEQVIVAKNNEEKLSYISGSLENEGIIKSVCNILEGGEEAFKQRRNRYHFK
ncbi:MAG: hypothetical protein ISS87_02665 [Candidatus Pacebacteria bacterium]|nr:hypothetical protein [Candidatus Paceibacterota bacterium]